MKNIKYIWIIFATLFIVLSILHFVQLFENLPYLNTNIKYLPGRDIEILRFWEYHLLKFALPSKQKLITM